VSNYNVPLGKRGRRGVKHTAVVLPLLLLLPLLLISAHCLANDINSIPNVLRLSLKNHHHHHHYYYYFCSLEFG